MVRAPAASDRAPVHSGSRVIDGYECRRGAGAMRTRSRIAGMQSMAAASPLSTDSADRFLGDSRMPSGASRETRCASSIARSTMLVGWHDRLNQAELAGPRRAELVVRRTRPDYVASHPPARTGRPAKSARGAIGARLASIWPKSAVVAPTTMSLTSIRSMPIG